MDPQQQPQSTQDQGGNAPVGEAPQQAPAVPPTPAPGMNAAPVENPAPTPQMTPTPVPVPTDPNTMPVAMPGPSVPTDNAPLPPKDLASKSMKMLIIVVVVAVVLAVALFAIFK